MKPALVVKGYGVVKYKPEHLSRILDIRQDLRSRSVASTIQRSTEAVLRSREILVRSRDLLQQLYRNRSRTSRIMTRNTLEK